LCCQVEISASVWSFVQRSTTEYGVSEQDHEASTTNIFWLKRECHIMMEIEEFLNTSFCLIHLCAPINRISQKFSWISQFCVITAVSFLYIISWLAFNRCLFRSLLSLFPPTLVLLFDLRNYRKTHSCGDINKWAWSIICISYKAFDYIIFGQIRTFYLRQQMEDGELSS
jgi:hypothetical protein